MGKDSVLGQDPLGWMKMAQENRKSIFLEGVNSTEKNTGKGDQQTSSQATLKQQKLLPTNNDETLTIPNTQQSQSKINTTANNTGIPKPKVVIGRLYEKPSPEKAKTAQRSEGMSQEPRHYPEPAFPVSRTVQPMKRTEPEINRMPASNNISTSASSFSAYIIIAYTALMLILGYFVYNDLSKRTSRIEARIFALEKALRAK